MIAPQKIVHVKIFIIVFKKKKKKQEKMFIKKCTFFKIMNLMCPAFIIHTIFFFFLTYAFLL